MTTFISKIDDKGRIIIPKEMRKLLGINKKDLVRMTVLNGKIVIEPLSKKPSVAEEFHGSFQVDQWPEDLDSFFVEVIKKWRDLPDTST